MHTPKAILLRLPSCALLALMGLLSPSILSAQLIGIAGDYGAFAGSTVTNTGSTVILGGLGVSPGTAITGFAVIDGGPGLFTGTLSQGGPVASQAHNDILSSYTALAALSFNTDLTGQDLGGLTLTPGVYRFDSSAQLTGVLTLDAQGDANARFVFQIGSALTTATDARVTLVNLDSVSAGGPEAGVYWQVGSSATIGVGGAFAGNILALTSITLNTGASIDYGRALAVNGAVTLDSNRIDALDTSGGFGAPSMTPVPEPSTYGLLGCGVLLFAIRRRLRQVRDRRELL
ncbi:MAG: DUF3494 domain-containing protein [Burkholderiales bacterium]|nr:DUF3494 domain-containing protein [Opitutaceae bacterium]